MDVQDVFEEWDDSEVMDMEEIESVMNDGEERSESSEGESTDSADKDDNDEGKLCCKKCKKQYRSKSWFLKHESKCDGSTKVKTCANNKKMSQHQIKTREVLSGLGVDDYFINNGLPAILKLLEEICETPADIVSIRGARYAKLKLQAEELKEQLQNKRKATSTVVEIFLKEVTQKLWKIVFALDHLTQTSTRQRYIAQHLTEFKISQPLFARWTEVTKACGITNEKLFLQKIISAVYENINEFRSTSVKKALDIADKYNGELVNKTVLTASDKSVVAYVAGYVCRKTKDKLQRYCKLNKSSATRKVQENCARLANIAKTFSKNLPCVEQQTPSLSYPNLITLTLNRGGLTTVDPSTFDFFSCLETSIRPYLNIANFRSSTRKSDSELLEQLIENTPALLKIWSYSSQLSSEDSMLLVRLCMELYYRVRKWAYLKVYKEHNKFKETLSNVRQNSVQLHGKDSIRKALMCSSDK